MASDPEELLRELEPLMEAALDEDALQRRIYDDVDKALGRIARDHFPHLGAWPAEQLRRLADRISRAACTFAGDLVGFDFAAQQAAKSPPAD